MTKVAHPFALLYAFLMLCPEASLAETILDRVLARIDAGPLVVSGGLYLNYAEQGDPSVEKVTTTVDGSVTVVSNSSAGIEETSNGGGLFVDEPADSSAARDYDIKVSTSSIGANNLGDIRRDHQHMFPSPEAATASQGAAGPSLSVVALNAASNRSDVLGSVSVLSSAVFLKDGSVSTSAIGATNTGSIDVVLSTSAATRVPMP